MSNAYTLSSRPIYKRSLTGPGVVDRTVQTILYHGEYFGDVPANQRAEDVLAALNESERKVTEYRAQFTDSEWVRQEDEAAGG